MLVYAWIAWNLIGGVVIVGTTLKKTRDDMEEDKFYRNCNEILRVLRINSRQYDYFLFYHVCSDRKQLNDCLNFLISNNLVEYIPESHRYYLVEKGR